MVIKSQALNYIQFAMMRRYDYGQKNQHFFAYQKSCIFTCSFWIYLKLSVECVHCVRFEIDAF